MPTAARLFLALPLLALWCLTASCSGGDPASSSPTTASFDFATADPCQLLTDQQRKDQGLSAGLPVTTSADSPGCSWSWSPAVGSPDSDGAKSLSVRLWKKPVDPLASALSGQKTDPVNGHPAFALATTRPFPTCGLLIGLGSSATLEVSIGYNSALSGGQQPAACQRRLPTLASTVASALRAS